MARSPPLHAPVDNVTFTNELMCKKVRVFVTICLLKISISNLECEAGASGRNNQGASRGCWFQPCRSEASIARLPAPAGFVFAADVRHQLGLISSAWTKRIREYRIQPYGHPADKRIQLVRAADDQNLLTPQATNQVGPKRKAVAERIDAARLGQSANTRFR